MAAPRLIRTACLVSSSLAIIILGCIYSFPIWLLKLKNEMDLSQKEMNILGVMNYIPGSFTMFLAPVLLGSVGPRYTLVIGILLSLTGYLLLYLCNAGYIARHLVIIATGMALYRCATGIFFPYLIGSLQEMYGKPAMLWVCSIISASFALGGLLASLAFLLIDPSLGDYFLGVLSIHAGSLPLLSLLLLWSGGVYKRAVASLEVAPPAESSRLLINSSELEDPADALSPRFAGQQHAPAENKALAVPSDMQVNEPIMDFFRAVLPSPDFWFACVVMLLKVGVGGTYSTNLGALMVAAGGSDHDVALSVVFLNGTQLLGRVIVAFWSVPRFRCGLRGEQQTLLVLGFVSIVYVATLTVSANILSLTSVFVITCVFGFAYGMMWTISGATFALTPRNTGKDFPRMAAVVYPFGGLGNLFLNLLTGALYDHASHGHVCTGDDCYSTSFYVMAGMSGTLLFLAIWRWQRGFQQQ